MRHAKVAAQALFGERIDELVLAGRGKDDAEHAQELILIGSHVLDGHHRELDGPDPAHLRNPVVRFFERRFLAEVLRVLTVAQALAFLDHALARGVVDGVDGLLHVVEPSLLGKAVHVAALRHDAAVLVAAASGLTHVERDLVLRALGGREVEVRREHTGRHVAELTADDVPRTGVELLFHTVARELHDAARHVLPLVAGVAGDAAEPARFLAQLRDVERLIERSIDIILLLLRCARDPHIHHVGDVADGLGALFPARLKDAHDLKQIRGHRRDLPVELPVGFFLWDELAPRGREAFPLLQFFL